MSILGLLTFRQPDQEDRFTALRALAHECNVQVEEVHLAHIVPGLAESIRSQLQRLFAEAAGWIVVSEYAAIAQLHSLSLLAEFRGRMVSGGRLLLSLPESRLDEANTLSAPFDVTGTDWRIRRRDMRDAYSLEFTRGQDLFKDPYLLSGVDRVAFKSVSALWYAGNAQPVVSFGRDPDGDSLLLVSGRTDFPVSEFTWQEVTPLVISYTEQDGGLLATSSIGLLSDPVTTVGGITFSGIDGNPQLARNILRFLTSTGSSARQTVQDKLHSLEVNLAEFVKTVGEAAFGNEWWERLVPEQERSKCAQRRRGTSPPITGLDFVDFRKIIARNWDLFLPYLTAVLGTVESRSQGLRWLDVIPSIRNAAAHPVREHFGEEIDAADRAAVYRAAQIANDLRHRSVQGNGGQPS